MVKDNPFPFSADYLQGCLYHRSRKVEEWLQAHEATIRLFYLPGYSPDPLGDTGGDHDLYDYCVDEPVGRIDPEGLQEKDAPTKSTSRESGEGSWYDDIPIVGSALQWFRQVRAIDNVEEAKETANDVLKRKYQTGQGSWDDIESSLNEFEKAQLENLKEAGKTMKKFEGEAIDRMPAPSR